MRAPYIIRTTAMGNADVVSRATGQRVGAMMRSRPRGRWYWQVRGTDAAGCERTRSEAAGAVWHAWENRPLGADIRREEAPK